MMFPLIHLFLSVPQPALTARTLTAGTTDRCSRSSATAGSRRSAAIATGAACTCVLSSPATAALPAPSADTRCTGTAGTTIHGPGSSSPAAGCYKRDARRPTGTAADFGISRRHTTTGTATAATPHGLAAVLTRRRDGGAAATGTAAVLSREPRDVCIRYRTTTSSRRGYVVACSRKAAIRSARSTDDADSRCTGSGAA